MGLDSYFGRKTIKNGQELLDLPKDLVFPELHLCGGVMSGNGSNGSFRGKVYDSFIRKISGETLYVKWNLDIKKIATALRIFVDSHKDTDPTDIVYNDDFSIYFRDVVDLCTLFEFAVENNLDYYGWW